LIAPRDGAAHGAHVNVEHMKDMPVAVIDGRNFPPSLEVDRMEADCKP
jgi:hypothetical protein